MSETQEFIKLENLADIIMGQSPDSASCNTDERGLPFLQGCAEFGRQSPNTNVYCFPPLRISKPDSVLMSVRAPVGKMNWGDHSYCIGRGLAAIKAKPNLADTKFLNYSLEQNVSFLHRHSQGSTFLAIGANDVKIFPIPAISYEKQKKISLILGTIDRTITHTEALIEKYQQIKAGLMHDLFTRGIGADGKLRPPRDQAPELYRESSSGWIPKEWDCATLITKSRPGVPHLRTGPFGSSLKGEHWVEEGTPVITIGALGEGKFDTAELFFINDFNANRLSDFQMKLGDVVFSRVADVGRSVVVNSEQVGWIMSSNLMRISLNQNLVQPDYLQYQLSYDFRVKKQISCKVNSGGRDVANSEVLNGLLFMWPSVDEQLEIIKRAETISSRINSENDKLQKLHKQKSGLMHDLLTGKVQVNIDSAEAVND
jgi:type I restriction enzyme, S subunit